jgi:inorganic pyrophosphatase
MKNLKNLSYLPEPELKMVPYDRGRDYFKTSICYQGVLRKHPYEPDTVILVNFPPNKKAMFYEFKLSDITHAEDLPNIVTEKGENISVVNLWIRRGSLGLMTRAFEVQPAEAPPSMPV